MKKLFLLTLASTCIVIPMYSMGITTLISSDVTGNIGNDYSYIQGASMSPNGQYVSFTSIATNLIPVDAEGMQDVFVKNVTNGDIKRASETFSGEGGNSASFINGLVNVSDDGRYVLFDSYATNLSQYANLGYQNVYVKDTVTNNLILISQSYDGFTANSYSYGYALSNDGRYVLFYSDASNIVADDTNGQTDVFVRDIVLGTTTRISMSESGTESNNYSYPISMTKNGKYILFGSYADNLVPNDTNNTLDIFLYDVDTGIPYIVSSDSNGIIGNADSDGTYNMHAISDDGRYVLFNSSSSNLVPNDTNGNQDIFVKDVFSGTISIVNTTVDNIQSNANSRPMAMSADGRYILFNSTASNFLTGNIDYEPRVYVKDMVTNTLEHIDVNIHGSFDYTTSAQGIDISRDGRYVLFSTYASDIVPYDQDYDFDFFIRDRLQQKTYMGHMDSAGEYGNNGSNNAVQLADTGTLILFQSYADNLALNDTNGNQDIFVVDRTRLFMGAPYISSPTNGSYIKNNNITISGIGATGAQVRVTLSGTSYITNTNISDGSWTIDFGVMTDGLYSLSAEQKYPIDTGWSVARNSQFTIDTITPQAPVILSPINESLISTNPLSIVGQGEPGATIYVTVGTTTLSDTIDGLGNWTLGGFNIIPGYKYSAIAYQVDQAGNRSIYSNITSFYAVPAGVSSVNTGDYEADIILSKQGISDNGNNNFTTGTSNTGTDTNKNIRYTLQYNNIGNSYASGVTIYETIPQDTCFTLGSIANLESDALIYYSNDSGSSYTYIPQGANGSQDCAITNIKIVFLTPLASRNNFVQANLAGINMNYLNNNGGVLYNSPSYEEYFTSNVPSYNPYSADISVTKCAADFNQDGYDDLTFGNLNVRYGSSTGLGNNNVVAGNTTNNSQCAVSYLNNDAYPDLVMYGNTSSFVQLYYGSASGLVAGEVLGSGFQYMSQPLDFNNDGAIDLMFYNQTPNRHYIYYSTGGVINTTTQSQFVPINGEYFGSMGSIFPKTDDDAQKYNHCDYNNDNYDDYVGFVNGGGRWAYYGSPYGFTGGYYFTGANARGFFGICSDINNDGYDDFVMNRFSSANDFVYFGSASGLNTNAPDWTLGSGPALTHNVLLLGNFNDDGRTDVIVGILSTVWSPTIVMLAYYQTGDKQFTGPFAITGQLNNSYQNRYLVADFDNDGYDDVYDASPRYYGYNDPMADFYFGGGTGSMGRKVYMPGDLDHAPVVGDFNGDGLSEVSRGWVALLHPYPARNIVFNTLISSSGSNTHWDKIITQETIVSGYNTITYTVYPTAGNQCNTGAAPLIAATTSTNGIIDISSINGSYTTLCIQTNMIVIQGSISPILHNLIATWQSANIPSFTFDVKVSNGPLLGRSITNIAYIASDTIEATTGNNTTTHIFTTPRQSTGSTTPSGGFGGGIGSSSNNDNQKDNKKDDKKNTNDDNDKPNKPSVIIKTKQGPQEVAEIIQKIKEIDIKKPEKPVVTTNSDTTNTPAITINNTSSTAAIKSAVVQTQSVSIGQTVAVTTVVNETLKTEKKCYTPKEVVDITLGKGTENKDLLVYQALLKSYDLTIFTNTDEYMPDNGLKRYEAAKMFTNFAKHILCRETIQQYTDDIYSDISNVDATLKPYIIEAYEYGILKGAKGKFRPLDTITRKEFVAALMRMFTNQNMDIEGQGNNWDENYIKAFEAYGLDSIIGLSESINRYEMSKIIYKLYYDTTYQRTDKGYVLPYKK